MTKIHQKKALGLIFLIIFLDIMAFGMVIPLSPILARDFGANGFQVGLLISVYALAQFVFAPFWGRLSDVIGRKPVLLIGLFGVTLAHLWFAFSHHLMGLFLARAAAGVFGGNITTATAYIADVTSKTERSKNMSLIGLGFGLGFTLGPALGGLFISLGKELGELPPFGLHFASFGAALLALINAIGTGIFLKESRQIQDSKKPAFSYLSSFKKNSVFTRPSLSLIWQSLRTPWLGEVLCISFLLWLALAQIEPTLILLVQDDFQWTQTMAYWGFAYIGFLMAFSQGILVRRLIPRFGERKINKWGLVSAAIGLGLMGASVFLSPYMLLLWTGVKLSLGLISLALAVTLFSVGYSLSNTSLSGALSLLGSSGEQGRIFGVNQSLSSVARIFGPALGGGLYSFSHSQPFFLSGLLALAGWFLAWRLGSAFPDTGKKAVANSAKEVEDEAIYSIDGLQLENLIAKKVHFHCFKLEAFDSGNLTSVILKEAFKNTEVVGENQLFDLLKSFRKEEPVVLVCQRGEVSQKLSQILRSKGYHNTYYVKSGAQALTE